MAERESSSPSASASALIDDDAGFRASIRRELRSVGRDKLPDGWNDDSHFRHDLGLDSLDLVELIARLEQVTGIFVPDEDVAQLVSISATVDYVRTRRFQSSEANRSARQQDEASS